MGLIDQILKNIRREREKVGYSQEYMAKKLGMNQSGYAKIEKGVTLLTLSRFFEIAKVLKLHILVFFEGTDDILIKYLDSVSKLKVYEYELHNSRVAREKLEKQLGELRLLISLLKEKMLKEHNIDLEEDNVELEGQL